MSLDDLQSAVHDHPARRPAPPRPPESRWTFEAVCVSVVVHCIVAVVASLLVLAARDPEAELADLKLARGEQAMVASVRLLTPAELEEIESLQSPTDPPPVTRVEPLRTDPSVVNAPPPVIATPRVDPVRVKEIERDDPPTIDAESLAPAPPPVALNPPTPRRLPLKPMPTEPTDPPAPEAPAAKRGIESGVELTDLPEPRYPTLAVRKGQEGVVVLEVQVLEDGTVGEVRVLRDPGFPLLVDAAIDAVRAASFSPAMIDGQPVQSRVTLRPIVFRIDER